ncbi:MAG: GIY-YIG nuclease family protein [Lachnospiraceae bacterium]|nr:GIY-YIG nuclease family protein [Lachnospiraceae bacterium]
MQESKLFVEKLDCVPGIYVIYNRDTKAVYIGQAKDLKNRTTQHVRALFVNKDDNANLQKEFDEGGQSYRIALLQTVSEGSLLDYYESLYYQAAKMLLEVSGGYEVSQVYNTMDLIDKMTPLEAELAEAMQQLKKVFHRKSSREVQEYSSAVQVRLKLKQDWLGMSNEKIVAAAREKVDELIFQREAASTGITEQAMEQSISTHQMERLPKLDPISLQGLMKSGELNYLIVGKMGDYVGEGSSQTFEEIMIEKLAEIACEGKCLWAAAGPTIQEAKRFREMYGFGQEKKLYALFSMTTSQYKNDNPSKTYCWTDADGKVYKDTAPAKKSGEFKALVIKQFWTVEEDFLVDDFYDQYYRYEVKYNGNQEYLLNSDVKNCSRQMQCVVSKKEILSNPKLQEELKLTGALLEEFIQTKSCGELTFREGEHPVFYILAEVVDYVTVRLQQEEKS